MKKVFFALLALFSLAAGIIVGLVAFTRRFLPQTRGQLEATGSSGPVEILRDSWGVPHIYADSEEDLFFAQGYVHAQDRLWQMDIQRRMGAGRLAEVLGDEALKFDQLLRTIGTNRAAEQEVTQLPEDSLRILEAYARGVNAYIDSHRGKLSLEFSLLRFEPEPWRPVDSVYWAKVMCLNLSSNMESEIVRALLTRKVGAELASDLEPPYPADNPTVVPGSGNNGGNIPPPNGWRSDALREALQLVEEILQPEAIKPPSADRLPGIPLTGGASNQWAVAGSRTATGQPLLANDTHMSIAMPALWYMIHLSGGRYHASGTSFPGAPGVVAGHNEHCAWGLTTAWQDAQDLYVERLNPDNPLEYEVDGEWQAIEIVRETIVVKGRPQPVIEEIHLTRHGPIISDIASFDQPLALRWVGHDPSDLLGSVLAYSRAKDWQEFRAGLANWATPAHNFVYADTAGNIAFIQAGWMPVRKKGFGMAPVPGWDPDYDWERFLTLDELPQIVNPESGWIGVANNLVVDPQYPHFLSADLENPSRATRLVSLITADDNLTAQDFAHFQLDTFSAQAKRFAKHLQRLRPNNRQEHQVLTDLKEWDYCMESDSVAAAITQVCIINCLNVVFRPHLGEWTELYVGTSIHPIFGVNLYHGRSVVRLLDMLDDPSDNTWLRDPLTGIPQHPDEVLHTALRITLKQMREWFGSDVSRWTWGRLNQVQFSHLLGVVKPLNLLFNRGPYPVGGAHDTMLRATGKPHLPLEPILGGDALRFVADPSDWERCTIMIPGGQSGHLSSSHYDDLIPLWRRGERLAMPFSRAAVERSAVERLILVPPSPWP
ncbi:MAG: penicillin acylase family protein [Chloroflexota bacterium]|nr:penicillin acylase family protein [Chloroflexota bacterium]